MFAMVVLSSAFRSTNECLCENKLNIASKRDMIFMAQYKLKTGVDSSGC